MRRWLAAALCWLGLVLAGASAAAQTDRVPPPDRPNVILILADDLGYGDLGAYGAREIPTPNLDRMAREGARLTRFFASGNVCTPSRAGLLTGRYPARAGLARDVIRPGSTWGLAPEEVTLAEALRAGGYRTHMIGKWHLGHVPGTTPTAQGFETFFGVRYSNDMTPFGLYRGEAEIEATIDQSTLTRRFHEEAVRIIDEAGAGGAPFFLYLAHTAPHLPLRPHPDHEGRTPAGPYGDVVAEIDAGIGMIRAALERTGQARRTLVLFTSDNGPWFDGAAGPFRDRKGGTFEGAYAVPLIAWQPGAVRRGTRSDAMTMNFDLYPTILARAGITPAAGRPLDGRDIWPVLQGARQSPHNHLFFFANDKIAAVRTPRWRYVVRAYYITYDVPFEQFAATMLFDLEADPGERFNLAGRNPDVMADMAARLAAGRAALETLPQFAPAPPAR